MITIAGYRDTGVFINTTQIQKHLFNHLCSYSQKTMLNYLKKKKKKSISIHLSPTYPTGPEPIPAVIPRLIWKMRDLIDFPIEQLLHQCL